MRTYIFDRTNVTSLHGNRHPRTPTHITHLNKLRGKLLFQKDFSAFLASKAQHFSHSAFYSIYWNANGVHKITEHGVYNNKLGYKYILLFQIAFLFCRANYLFCSS
jgi:hypothetical protein